MEIQLTAEEKRQLNAGYNQALADFDKATCEAMAVSQAIGVQMAEAHIGIQPTYSYGSVTTQLQSFAAFQGLDGCALTSSTGTLVVWQATAARS